MGFFLALTLDPWPRTALAASVETTVRTNQQGRVLTAFRLVEYYDRNAPPIQAQPNQRLGFGDTLRTLPLARAVVIFDGETTLQMRDQTRLFIEMPPETLVTPRIRVGPGDIYVSNRGTGPQRIVIETVSATVRPKGTEFLVSVDPGGNRTEVTLFDGEAELSNDVSTNLVRSGQQGIAVAGREIQVRPVLQASNLVQWWIYYPGVLDLDDLQFSPSEQAALGRSLSAYRTGDLQQALMDYPGHPTPPEPTSDAQRLYLAGVLLSVGAVDRAEAWLTKVDSNAPPARALRTMIRAVAPPFGVPASAGMPPVPSNRPKTASSPVPEDGTSITASELLALSYAHQATNNLKAALAVAREAVTRSTNFGFAWARVGELEFSFGRTRQAHTAVKRALELAPRNAQAHCVNGFLLAAEYRLKEAIAAFDRAIEIDPALGNAWLGRGLCKRRLGWFWREGVSPHGVPAIAGGASASSNAPASSDASPAEAGTPNASPQSAIRNPQSAIDGWLSDLQTAATLEPRRSLLRSYAGKAFAENGEAGLARKELDYAKQLDPNDPTPWLYSALNNWQENRINEAIGDLEYSMTLNDNRALFRSRELLDEDRAVRGTGLAKVYRDAGASDVAVREATRAVSYDYANYAAHQFLAESYDALRDPTRFSLRHETVWFNELLLANLLAPVGAGTFSQNISQQEYSRLFEANHLGLTTSTEYRSDGQWRERATHSATLGRLGYALDLDYQHNDGVRPNNELDRLEWYTTVKQQLGPQDSLLLLTKYQNYHSGDNFQYYDPREARHHFSFDEEQHPIVLGGYHHEWSPGVHTLLLGGRLESEQHFSDRSAEQLLVIEDSDGKFDVPVPAAFDVEYRNELEVFTGEINQIFKWDKLTLVAGGRGQSGTFNARARMDNPTGQPPELLEGIPTNSMASGDFDRFTAYSYLTLEPLDRLWVMGGVAYDTINYPRNFRNPPVSDGQDHRTQFGPKAALVWNPVPPATLRGAFSRSLGGVSLDESYRLEPAQLAGFPQAFRTIIPESLVGSVAAPAYETLGLAMDLKFPSRTYAGVQAERLTSKVRRTIGLFTLKNGKGSQPFVPDSTSEHLDYRENSLALSVNQLVGDTFVLGASYKVSDVQLHDVLPEVPANSTTHAVLNHAHGYVLFNHPLGFFARAETHWYRQHNSGYSPALAGDDFFQHNLFVGYRFPHRRGEIVLGLLNLTSQDYRLNPLNAYEELPRERALQVKLRLQF